jgi:hypothetical protein
MRGQPFSPGLLRPSSSKMEADLSQSIIELRRREGKAEDEAGEVEVDEIR